MSIDKHPILLGANLNSLLAYVTEIHQLKELYDLRRHAYRSVAFLLLCLTFLSAAGQLLFFFETVS